MQINVCVCCGEKMAAGSPRNPNVCVSCEQLLADDGGDLQRLLSSIETIAYAAPSPFDDAHLVEHVEEQQEVLLSHA